MIIIVSSCQAGLGRGGGGDLTDQEPADHHLRPVQVRHDEPAPAGRDHHRGPQEVLRLFVCCPQVSSAQYHYGQRRPEIQRIYIFSDYGGLFGNLSGRGYESFV